MFYGSCPGVVERKEAAVLCLHYTFSTTLNEKICGRFGSLNTEIQSKHSDDFQILTYSPHPKKLQVTLTNLDKQPTFLYR